MFGSKILGTGCLAGRLGRIGGLLLIFCICLPREITA